MEWLFDEFMEDPEEDRPDPGEDRNCSPEILLEWLTDWLKTYGRSPTIGEVKKRFGGLIGPMMDAHELKKREEYPAFPARKKMPWYPRSVKPKYIPLGKPL